MCSSVKYLMVLGYRFLNCIEIERGLMKTRIRVAVNLRAPTQKRFYFIQFDVTDVLRGQIVVPRYM